MRKAAKQWLNAAYYTGLSGLAALVSGLISWQLGSWLAMALLIPVFGHMWRQFKAASSWGIVYLGWFVALANEFHSYADRVSSWSIVSVLWHVGLMLAIAWYATYLQNKEEKEALERQRQQREAAEAAFREYARKLTAAQRAAYIEAILASFRADFERQSRSAPPPPPPQIAPWRKVLGLTEATPTLSDVSRVYRRKAMELHQAGKGDSPQMVQLNLARDAAKKALGNG